MAGGPRAREPQRCPPTVAPTGAFARPASASSLPRLARGRGAQSGGFLARRLEVAVFLCGSGRSPFPSPTRLGSDKRTRASVSARHTARFPQARSTARPDRNSASHGAPAAHDAHLALAGPVRGGNFDVRGRRVTAATATLRVSPPGPFSGSPRSWAQWRVLSSPPRRRSSAAEQLFRKQQVLGSNPSVGSTALRTNQPRSAVRHGSPGLLLTPAVTPAVIARYGRRAERATPSQWTEASLTPSVTPAGTGSHLRDRWSVDVDSLSVDLVGGGRTGTRDS
jgi:hypothetical protein